MFQKSATRCRYSAVLLSCVMSEDLPVMVRQRQLVQRVTPQRVHLGTRPVNRHPSSVLGRLAVLGGRELERVERGRRLGDIQLFATSRSVDGMV